MGNRLYVANLSYQTSESELEEVFQQCGSVSSVQIVMDRDTNRSRGYAFVEMATADEAARAIKELNGFNLNGRSIVVNEARSRGEGPGERPGKTRRK